MVLAGGVLSLLGVTMFYFRIPFYDFVVLSRGRPGYPGFNQEQAVLATFGKPARTYHVGSYTVLVNAKAHEAAPVTVDVRIGEYTDLELQARRTFSDGGRIISLETSLFIPCAVSSPAITVTVGCLLDQSGDSYRTGFTTNFNGIQACP